MKTWLAAAAAAMLVGATPASATLIDFSDRPFNDVSVVTYPEVTFTSSTGRLHFEQIGGPPKFICALVVASFECTGTLTLTFTQAVDNLVFNSLGDDAGGANLFATVTSRSGITAYTGQSDGQSDTRERQDLSALRGVTSVSLSSSDFKGLGFTSFSFDLAAPVPEPATWAMMLIGFGAAGYSMRRRSRVSTRVRYA